MRSTEVAGRSSSHLLLSSSPPALTCIDVEWDGRRMVKGERGKSGGGGKGKGAKDDEDVIWRCTGRGERPSLLL